MSGLRLAVSVDQIGGWRIGRRGSMRPLDMDAGLLPWRPVAVLSTAEQGAHATFDSWVVKR